MFKKSLNRILAGGIAIIMGFMPSMPAFAATDTYSVTSAGSKSVTVSYTQASTFEVTIPKTITLGTNKDADYSVTVKGDIDADHYVSVVPDSTFTLSDANGKSNVTATVSLDDTEFTYDTINGASGYTTDGTVSAGNLTAGNWSGSLNFAISLEEVSKTYAISWASFASDGSYIGTGDISSDTSRNYGGKRIVYTNADGVTSYANPYTSGSIEVLQGTAIKFEMYAASTSDGVEYSNYENSSITLTANGSTTKRTGISGELITCSYTPLGNGTISGNADTDGWYEFWRITFTAN